MIMKLVSISGKGLSPQYHQVIHTMTFLLTDNWDNLTPPQKEASLGEWQDENKESINQLLKFMEEEYGYVPSNQQLGFAIMSYTSHFLSIRNNKPYND